MFREGLNEPVKIYFQTWTRLELVRELVMVEDLGVCRKMHSVVNKDAVCVFAHINFQLFGWILL